MKPYNNEDKSVSGVSEPGEVYGRNTIRTDNSVIASFDNNDAIDTMYDKLKVEADKIYGVKEYYTPEEYFGKLRYMVNGFYGQNKAYKNDNEIRQTM